MRESNEQAPCHAKKKKKKKKQIKPEASFSEVICTATVQSQNPQTLPTNFLTKTQDCGNKVDFKCLFTIYYFAAVFLWRSLSWCCPGKRKSTPTGQKQRDLISQQLEWKMGSLASEPGGQTLRSRIRVILSSSIGTCKSQQTVKCKLSSPSSECTSSWTYFKALVSISHFPGT